MKSTIIGAGIGGLTLAIALQQKGIEVEIFEATPAFRQVGAGIVIAINSMQIFQRLGIEKKIANAGNRLGRMEITNQELKPISTSDIEAFEKIYKLSNIAIHRATLHEVLLSELPNIPLHLNKKLKQLEQKNGVIDLIFEDGTTHQTNLLIGADGLHSAVRKFIFPAAKERLAKQICWRGVANFELESNYKNAAREAWGIGQRFGIVPIGQKLVYWYACANYEKDAKMEFQNKSISSVYTQFAPVVQEIIAATPTNAIITSEIGDLEPIPTWYQDNICLLGDAAHATTPNMGQGANQAIESAWVLADCLSKENDLQKAFAQYQQIRKAKANGITNTSWQVGKVAHVTNPFLAKLRNGLFGLMPNSLAQKQMKKLFELNY